MAMFIRRLGENRTNHCEGGHYCPQILLMKDGNFTAVGRDVRRKAIKALPPGPGIGPKEGAVVIPRDVMLDALVDLLQVLKAA